jgi:enoyl-CoA hydratase/carnithine racemase
VLDATEMKSRGFLHAVLADEQVAPEASARAQRIAGMAPQAARLNKQTMRSLLAGAVPQDLMQQAYRYADSPEHREGIDAFLSKRTPVF